MSNLLDGARLKANSEGEFFLTTRLDDGYFKLQSESESESSSDCEDSSSGSASENEDSTSESEDSSDD